MPLVCPPTSWSFGPQPRAFWVTTPNQLINFLLWGSHFSLENHVWIKWGTVSSQEQLHTKI